MDAGGPWDDIASRLLEDLDLDPPIDPLDVVVRLELDVRLSPRALRPCLVGDVILLPAGMRAERAGFAMLHEVGHILARREGCDSEAAANAIASSILLPRRTFIRDMRETSWSLFELRERHPHASHEALARRIMSLQNVVLVVADRAPERRQYRLRSHGLGARLARPLAIERELVDAADASGEPQGPSDLLRAWPVVDGAARRVLLVGEAEALEMAARFSACS